MKNKRKSYRKNRIAYWRKKRGKTLQEVGTALGIKKAAASLKEKGKSPITGDELYLLADFFNCEMSEILEEDNSAIPYPNEIAQKREKFKKFAAGTMIDPVNEEVVNFFNVYGSLSYRATIIVNAALKARFTDGKDSGLDEKKERIGNGI